MTDYRYLLKLIIVGDSSVGKSAMLTQFLHGCFSGHNYPTVGAEFGSKVIPINQ